MVRMKRGMEAGLVAAVLFALAAWQFRHHLGPGHYLYLAMIEDPGARYSWFPWDYLAALSLRAGHFPLWNPYSGTGMPLLANYHSALFFPLKFFYYLLPHPRVMDLMVILRLSLAGAFTFWLARGLGRSRSAGFLAGAAFALCGYLMKFMNVAHVANEMWLPLCLGLVLIQRRSRRPFAVMAAASLVWALVLMGGNPEAAFYTAFTTLLFALALGAGRGGFVGELTAGFIAPFLAGGMIASVQTLPFLEYLPQAWHVHDPQLHLAAATSPRFLWSLIAPWLLGPSGSHPGQLVSPPYIGAAIFLLAAIGVFQMNKRSRPFLFLAGAAVLLLAIGYRLPPLGYLSWLPPFNRSGNIKFAFLPISLIAAILAGHGLDAIQAPGYRSRQATVPIALTALLLIGGMAHCRFGLGTLDKRGLSPAFVVLIFSSLAIVWASRRRAASSARRRQTAALLIAGLALLELYVHFLGFKVTSAMLADQLRFPDAAPAEVLARVAADPLRPRFTGTRGALHPNLNIFSRAADLRAFEAMYPLSYVRAMAEIDGFKMEEAVPAFFRSGWMFEPDPDRLSHPLVDELGVKYVVSRDEISAPGFEPAPEGPAGEYRLYVNREAYARAWVETDGPRSAAEYILENGDRVTARGAGPGELVVGDTYFPGWEARVEGREVRLEERKGLMRALPIRPGRVEVEMTYRPRAFRIGLWMALVSLAALIGGMIISVRSRAGRENNE